MSKRLLLVLVPLLLSAPLQDFFLFYQPSSNCQSKVFSQKDSCQCSLSIDTVQTLAESKPCCCGQTAQKEPIPAPIYLSSIKVIDLSQIENSDFFEPWVAITKVPVFLGLSFLSYRQKVPSRHHFASNKPIYRTICSLRI